MSTYVREFCNTEGIEIVQSPVNDHRATGCIERTIGSLELYTHIRTGGTAGTFRENGRKSTWGSSVFAECYSKINAIRSSPWQGSEHCTPKF